MEPYIESIGTLQNSGFWLVNPTAASMVRAEAPLLWAVDLLQNLNRLRRRL